MSVVASIRSMMAGRSALKWIVAVNTAIFLLSLVLAAVARFGGPQVSVATWLGLSGYLPELSHRPWTPLTYMVTHVNGLHFIFNMLWMWCFGLMMGDRRFLSLYIGGGVAGAAAFLIASAIGGAGGLLIGASASVLSLTLAAGVLYPDVPLRLFLIGNVKLKWVALVCVALAFAGLDGGNAGGGWAHAGGLLYGLSAALYIRYGARLRGRLRRDRKPSVPRSLKRKLASRVDENLTDEEALDALLDKIRLSGYDSLTRADRSRLELLSRRLKKP